MSALDTPVIATFDLLGVTFNRNLIFGSHREKNIQDVRKRIGSTISRGLLLSEIARAIVIWKLQTSAGVTRSAKFSSSAENTHSPPRAKASKVTQLVINDLARVLLGIRRSDRLRVADLLNRSHFPSVKEIIVKEAVISTR
ncbi:Hypothetical protein FKW44_012783 [Caligus rogercresseyi]|uniref:Uncharacterized protein n=1 Tax=Caligus rogercresseyi TaxID=217165 RepID=A0A7T8HK84_CALRO|nr:Hypothetical protein FKW44_012783 [Caligus rogercresseyi]